jgi:hypothetical protein
MLATRTAAATKTPTNRAAMTNDPLRVRADGRTPQGRRIRDLFRAWHMAMGRPSDPTVQALVLTAAELTVAAETARAALLAGTGDVDAVVRLENLASRSVRKLGIKPSPPPKPQTIREYIAGLRPLPSVAATHASAPEEQPPPEAQHRPSGADGEASGGPPT